MLIDFPCTLILKSSYNIVTFNITMSQFFMLAKLMAHKNFQNLKLFFLFFCFISGAIRAHNGSLQHLTWLGLQWDSLPTLPAIRKWLKQLFHHLPQETSRLETNAPESICILDLEVSIDFNKYHEYCFGVFFPLN